LIVKKRPIEQSSHAEKISHDAVILICSFEFQPSHMSKFNSSCGYTLEKSKNGRNHRISQKTVDITIVNL
jgi:hypothetical protein